MKNFLSIIFVTLINASFAQINLSSSLTACYALNGNVNEPINNLTGTLSAVTATVDRFNNPNSAYQFAGNTSSYIKLPNDPLLKSNIISFSAWVKTSTSGLMDIVFTKNTSGSNFAAYVLDIENNGFGYKFRAYRQNGTVGDYIDCTTTIVPNTWYHVAFSIDNTSIKIYVNGVLEGTTPSIIQGFSYDLTRSVILGGTNELAANFPLNGIMDNVRFYNRVLNASEVAQLYSQDPTCLGGPVPVASFSASALSICANQTVALTDLSTFTPTAWAWQTPGATTSVSTINNPVVTYPVAGNYTISLTATNGFGQSNPFTQTVTVKSVPLVTVSANNTLICIGSNAVLLANGANTYSWSNGQTFPAINVSPTVTSTYSVVGTTTNGCQNTSSITVNVNSCTFLKQNMADKYFEIFPNPTSGKFTINAFENVTEIMLFNLLGELILKTELSANETKQIDISEKASGVYFLKFNMDGIIVTRKLIKEYN